MTRVTELTPLLKQLRLGQMATTLPERIALARREQLDYASFLEIILSDEVNRRAHRRIEVRLNGAVSRRPAGWRTSTGRRPSPWTPIAGRRLLPGVSGQARTRAAGGTRWRRQELPGPGPGLLGRPRRIHRALQPRRRLLQGHGPSQSGQLTGPRLPIFPHPRSAHPR